MSKKKNRSGSNWSWKKMICAFLAFAAVVASVGGITAIIGNKTKTISPLSFEVGALDENGKYKEDNQSIYTKEAFNCIGLRVEPEFDSQLTYDVYYYDYNGVLIEKKLGFEGIYDEDFPIAKMARIVVHPEIPEDIDDDEFKISFFDKYEYARKVKITVDKNQEYLYDNCLNLYDANQVTENMIFNSLAPLKDWSSTNLVESLGANLTNKIAVDGSCDKIDIYIYLESGEGVWPAIGLFNADGSLVKVEDEYFAAIGDVTSVVKPCWYKMSLEIPKLDSYEGVHLMVKIPTVTAVDAPSTICYIFAYND